MAQSGQRNDAAQQNDSRLCSSWRSEISLEPFLLFGDGQQTVAHFDQALVFVATAQRIFSAGVALRRPAPQFGRR